MKPKNFYPSIETETKLKPYDAFESLAVDAAMLHYDEQLAGMSDEEAARLTNAAAIAARTVLQLARVPDDWLALVAALHRDEGPLLRSELHDAVYDLMGRPPKHITEAEREAIDRVRDLCLPGRRDELHKALLDYEFAHGLEVLDACEQAFRVGYNVARDPFKLIFEVKRDD